MGKFLNADIASAHISIVKEIATCGDCVTTQDGEETLEYEPIIITIPHPFDGERIAKCSPFGQSYMDRYSENLLHGYGNNVDFVYDYNSRLFDYNSDDDYENGENQIEYIIKTLTKEPTSRRAQAITWIPDVDMYEGDVPCLQLVQCTIRDNKLNMNVVFRSNDMLMAFGANAYALTKLQEYICNKIGGIEIGTYTHTSLIPHVYDKRDKNYLDAFLRCY